MQRTDTEQSTKGRPWWMWFWVVIIACWLVVNHTSALRQIYVEAPRARTLGLPEFYRFSLLVFHMFMLLISVWGIIVGIGLLTAKDFWRRLTIAFCWAQLGVMCYGVLQRILYQLSSGHSMQVPSQYVGHYQVLSQLMYSIYTVAIIVFLSRRRTLEFFHKM